MENAKGDRRADVLREAVLRDQLVTSKIQEQRSLETILRNEFTGYQSSIDRRKKGDVISILKKAVPFIDDVVSFEKFCRSTYPSIANEDALKKLFENQ